jgi:aminoglycoside phosphotransferase (APT) family kinase protein
MWPEHDPTRIQAFARTLPDRLGRTGEVLCVPWREGASNSVWRLDIGGAALVLKVGKLPHWRRLGHEASILEILDGRGSPCLRAHGSAEDGDLPWDWSVLERIEGRHPYELDPDQARSLGACLRRIRSVPLARLPQRTWRGFVEERILSPVRSLVGTSVPTEVVDRFHGLLARVEELRERGDDLDAHSPGLVHGDLIPLNLIEDGHGSMHLLDWENPSRGPAAWDLAGIRKAFRLEGGAWNALLESVGEPVPTVLLDFAEGLLNLQVAAWRAQIWWLQENRVAGEHFLEELDLELEMAGHLLPPSKLA